MKEDGLPAFYYGNRRLYIGGKSSLVIPEENTPTQAQSYESDIEMVSVPTQGKVSERS